MIWEETHSGILDEEEDEEENQCQGKKREKLKE